MVIEVVVGQFVDYDFGGNSAGKIVKEIKGDYFSVMGLPVAQSARVLGEFGIQGKITV